MFLLLKLAFKKHHINSILKKNPSLFYLVKWLILCAIIGISVGTASAFFLWSLNWVTDFRESHLWLLALLPIAGLLIGLLYHYYGKSVETGNNLLIDTIHEPENSKTIPFKMAPLVLLGTLVTHLFGGSAGREGTALQMAGAISDQFSRPFGLHTFDRKILIIASISAGFGSVFGTPLAGAIFALEVFIIGKMRYDAIFPAFAAGIIAHITTLSWNTPHTHYHIPVLPQLNGFTVLYSVVAGIAFGVTAMAFSKATLATSKVFKTIHYAPLRPFVGGIIVSVLLWFLGKSAFAGLGIPTIVQSFDTQLPYYDFAIKMLLTILTISAGFKGGEVTPLFFIGATLGNALSLFIPLPMGLLAGMGFVAVFAGATNTPLACMVMGIELFGGECGIYVAIACIVSYLISGHNSIYRSQMIGEPKHLIFSQHRGKRVHDI